MKRLFCSVWCLRPVLLVGIECEDAVVDILTSRRHEVLATAGERRRHGLWCRSRDPGDEHLVSHHLRELPTSPIEESFNLHAVHDVLMYGLAPSSLPNYDHFVFCGSRSRTFIGSPAIYLASSFGLVPSKFELQVIVRLVLASINALGLCLIRRFGRPAGLYYTLIACSQFHVPFWMGRTLPNMFALFPVNLSAYLLIACVPNTLKPSQRSVIVSIASLVFSAVVFPFTVSVDSYFWGRPYLWPEWHSIYFNVVEGKSADWGVYFSGYVYLTLHLPKLLLSALPLLLFVAFSSSPRRLVSLVFPSAVLVGAMSALGHKEWVSQRKSSLLGCLLFGALLANLGAIVLLTVVGMRNYPGGHAMAILNTRASGPMNAHIANLALQSGASLFMHMHAPPYPAFLANTSGAWVYDKTDNPASFAGYTHLVAESAAPVAAGSGGVFGFLGRKKDGAEAGWTELGRMAGFERWALDLGLLRLGEEGAGMLERVQGALRLEERPRLWVLERTGK
ncbi:alpha-1,6-mannosyltransferase subunit [Mycena olivaceomarginata]|nr:alpha-1,6-mannosyltransferase subunit [Mycena olivaceomarginata]